MTPTTIASHLKLVATDKQGQPHPERRLIGQQDLEIESFYQVSSGFSKFMRDYAGLGGITPDASQPLSPYFDTLDLDLFYKGLTLRDRLAGTTKKGTHYDNVFGMKYRALSFQKAAAEITARVLPHKSQSQLYVRTELERSHTHPRHSSELRFQDLPEDIRAVMTARGIADDSVFKPFFISYAQRKRFNLFIDPARPLPLFKQPSTPHRDEEQAAIEQIFLPSEEKKRSGKLVCFEIALDKLQYRVAPPGTLIRDMFEAEKTNFAGYRCIGKRRLLEYEFLSKESGAGITDTDLVMAHHRLQQFLLQAANMIKPYGKPLSSVIQLTSSKASTGYELCLKDRKDAAMLSRYENAKALAP